MSLYCCFVLKRVNNLNLLEMYFLFKKYLKHFSKSYIIIDTAYTINKTQTHVYKFANEF